MTLEQIRAINNGMSMLADLYNAAACTTSVADFKAYMDKHVKALKDSGVDINIVEHFECLTHFALPLAEQASKEYADYRKSYEDLESIR